MGTAVLRSHDCLKDRLHLEFFGSRTPPPMNLSRKKPLRSLPSSSSSSSPLPLPPIGRFNRSPLSKPKPKPARSNPTRPGGKLGSPGKENARGPEIRTGKNLVMEEVTILKRGEELKPVFSQSASATVDRRLDGDDLVLFSTNRLGPDPEILPKFSDLGSVYAGPAFISSPSPSSLPFPAFFLKKGAEEASKSNLATKGLRCLLRLDDLP